MKDVVVYEPLVDTCSSSQMLCKSMRFKEFDLYTVTPTPCDACSDNYLNSLRSKSKIWHLAVRLNWGQAAMTTSTPYSASFRANFQRQRDEFDLVRDQRTNKRIGSIQYFTLRYSIAVFCPLTNLSSRTWSQSARVKRLPFSLEWHRITATSGILKSKSKLILTDKSQSYTRIMHTKWDDRISYSKSSSLSRGTLYHISISLNTSSWFSFISKHLTSPNSDNIFLINRGL